MALSFRLPIVLWSGSLLTEPRALILCVKLREDQDLCDRPRYSEVPQQRRMQDSVEQRY